MPRYHVTTFGCQMNEHDSERMKGMLESLGYAECAERRRGRPDPVQHLLDPREGRRALRRAPAPGQGAQAPAPEVVIGVGGCWAQSVKDEVFRQFPFVDVAFGPGQVHKLAEFLTSDSLTAQGYFEFEDFAGRLPMKRAREFQGWVQISAGCNMTLLVLHRALDARARGVAAARGARRRGRGARRRRRPRGHAARPERQLLRHATCGREPRRFSRAAARGRRDRRASTASATRQPAPGAHGRGRRPRARRAGERLRAHPPAAAVGLVARAQGDAPHLRPRALHGPRRADPRARAGLRDDDRHHRRLPGGDRGGVRARRSRSSRRSGSTARSRSSTRRGATPRRRRSPIGSSPHEVQVERMERLVEVVQRRARERAQRFVGRTLDVLVEGPSRNDPSRLRGRTTHNKVVNFDGPRAAGRDRAGARSPRRRARRSPARRRCVARRAEA